jgi:ribosomal protein S24E
MKKKSNLLLLAFLTLLFAGCRTVKQTSVSDSVERVEKTQTDSVVIRETERVEAVNIPTAIASVSVPVEAVALLPAGAVFTQQNGRATVTVSRDSSGNITAEARCDSLEVLITNIRTEYEHYRTVAYDSLATLHTQLKTVQRESSWASLGRWYGRVFLGLVVLTIVYFLLKWKFKF